MMRKPMHSTLKELIKENKEELINDPVAISEIEKRLEEKQSKEGNITYKKVEND